MEKLRGIENQEEGEIRDGISTRTLDGKIRSRLIEIVGGKSLNNANNST